MALSIRREVNSQLVTSFVHLWLPWAEFVTVAAETPLPVAEALVRVLVGFGGGRAAIWRLLAMVGAQQTKQREF